jgi:hypothetical protein
MTNRGALEHGFSTIALAGALWAWSGGVASAQICEIDCPPPSPVVQCQSPEAVTQCTGEGGECTCPTGFYEPGQNVAKVFTFGNNNSIQVKFDEVTCSFGVNVELIPTMQSEFQPRVLSIDDGGICPFTTVPRPYPSTPEISCNETVDVDGDGLVDQCAVYRVSFTTTTCYTQGPLVVGYTIGWLDPAVKKNKHDYMLVRDPDFGEPGDDSTACFVQDITDKLLRNYDVGTITDPGLGGRTCCPSEYVVARQRVRPAR